MYRKRKQIIEKSEIANIIFEHSERQIGGRKRIFQSLHIMFKNGIQNDYFNFSSNPPCFTKYEVDYFNNEVKKIIRKLKISILIILKKINI